MLRLGLAERAREGELGIVGHRLLAKAQQRVPIDGLADGLDQPGAEPLRQVDSGHERPEVGVQGLQP